jgi:hypothetical protein
MADLSAEGADPVRADARHGRRRQGGRHPHREIGLRDKGVAVLVLSTEPETILTLADRVTVLRRGVVAKEFTSGHRKGGSARCGVKCLTRIPPPLTPPHKGEGDT